MHDLVNSVPILLMYGRWIQIVRRTCSSCWLLKFAAAVSSFFGENDLIMRRGYPFHDANSVIPCSSFANRQLLLQILCARYTSALSNFCVLTCGRLYAVIKISAKVGPNGEPIYRFRQFVSKIGH